MRILIEAVFPHEPANSYAKEGTLGSRIEKIMADLKPEAAYFLEKNGKRCGIVVVNMKDPSELPKYAEPFFLTFGADATFHPAMTAADLAKANVSALGKKWG